HTGGLAAGREALLETGRPQPLDWHPFFEELAADRRAAVLHGVGGRPPLWVAAERLSQLRAVYGDLTLEPAIEPPPRAAERAWSPDEALVELVRGRLEGLGPVTEARLAQSFGLRLTAIQAALGSLEAEGFVLRGRFTPGESEQEWCERRLLARINRYTLNRLRQEIQPVTAADFMRFLFSWQGVSLEDKPEGAEALAAVLAQLEGYESPAAAWEAEILPARMEHYDPLWLDGLCVSGRAVWARLTPPGGSVGNSGKGGAWGPVRATPLTFVSRRNLGSWSAWVSRLPAGREGLSSPARRIVEHLLSAGASFFDDLVAVTGLLPTQIEVALGELVSAGRVTSDGYQGLRSLITPSHKRPPIRGGRRKGITAALGMAQAGRWSLLHPARLAGATEDGGDAETSADGRGPAGGRGNGSSNGIARNGSAAARPWESPAYRDEELETVAWTLLRRYGLVFRRVLDRERSLPPWRELLRFYRRLEARGEIRGGRFVSGFTGEQYALPEAVTALREMRRKPPDGRWISISGADPLNLVGIVTPGARLPAIANNRALFRDGVPVAIREGGRVVFLAELDSATRWEATHALHKRTPPLHFPAHMGERG
ncbi:MAG: ATP-dependent DNA helicase, partial [SAR324 cluster bacterium]|nr:ATP-dependent DNA helicase [SAR324 cluster bacterium]